MSPCDLLASFINPSVRRVTRRCGPFDVSCDFLTTRPALSFSFVPLSSASVLPGVALLPFLQFPACLSPSPLFFHIIALHSAELSLSLSLRLTQVSQAPESVCFFVVVFVSFGSLFAQAGSLKEQ